MGIQKHIQNSLNNLWWSFLVKQLMAESSAKSSILDVQLGFEHASRISGKYATSDFPT